MTYDSDIRLVPSDQVSGLTQYRDRTPQQKHTDQAMAWAADAAHVALESATEAIQWMTSIGADVPNRLKGLPTLLVQFSAFIDDEKRRRG